MSKISSGNSSFSGNFIYDQLHRRRNHFLFDLLRFIAINQDYKQIE
jgi:hypothetical protein